MKEGMKTVKEVMAMYAEANNEAKEETVNFGEEEGQNILILGSYLGGGWQGKTKERRHDMGKARKKVKEFKTIKKNAGKSD